MAAPEPRARVDALEDMKDVLNSRRSELASAHGNFGSKTLGPKGMTALTKLHAYRDGKKAINHYNQTMTERLLRTPTGRQHNGQASSTADGPGSKQRVTSSGGSEDTRVFLNPGESTSSTLTRVTRSNRALQDRVKMLEEELEKYKCAFENINTNVTDISNESRSTNEKVTVLADELQIERSNHERARHSLEHKAREVEEQAAMLTELERTSSKAHRENLVLSARIQDLNRQAEEQQAAAASSTGKAAGADASGQTCVDRDGAESGTMVPAEDFKDLEKELTKTKETLESTSAILDMVRSKANGFEAQLSRYKTWSRFWKLIWTVWLTLARVVGFMGFLLFAYLAVSEDSLRLRGIDIYRLAH